MGALHLSNLIDRSLVFINSPMKDLREIYAFMVRQKNKKYPMHTSVHELVNRLLKRNQDSGIFFPIGVAVPHLHLDSFNDTVVSVLIPEKPIQTEYGTIKIFFMIFACTSNNSLYLHILQSIVKIAKDEAYFEKLLKAKNQKEFKKILAIGDLFVKQALTVRDIMISHVYTVSKNASLKDLGELFYEHNIGYYPVLDENQNMIGEVTISDYMMAAFPAYTNYFNNFNFLKSFEPFERFLKDEDTLKVERVMKPVEVSINPDTTIIEAIFLINKYNKRSLPVLENQKLVGIISFMNIFRKLIKG